MKTRSVSTCVTSYNSAQTLSECLDSILAQSLPPTEVIVADDGSLDDSVEIARSYGKSVTVSLASDNHGGPAWGRNRAVRAAKADLVAFCDADDTWLPQKLEEQLAQAPPDSLAICTSAIRKYPDGTTSRYPVGKVTGNHTLSFADLAKTNHVVASSAVVDRTTLLSVGCFLERQFAVALEDYICWLKVATKAPWYFVDNESVVYADGGPSLRTSRRRSQAQVRFNVARALANGNYAPSQPSVFMATSYLALVASSETRRAARGFLSIGRSAR